MKRLTLTKQSGTTLISEEELTKMLDDFLEAELTKQTQQSTAQQGDRVALRLELERLDRNME